MDKNQLSENIRNSDLSEKDKEILIQLLAVNDIEGFAKYFVAVCKVAKEILKLFDIDLGD